MFKDHEKLHERYLVLVLLEMKRIIRIVMLGMVIVVMITTTIRGGGDDDDDDVR